MFYSNLTKDKNRLKIFVTFFVLYVYFMYWQEGISNSYYYLTKAVVEDKQFVADKYAGNMVDRSVYGSHYYSNKAPGVSFLSVIPYSIAKHVLDRPSSRGSEQITDTQTTTEERWFSGVTLKKRVFLTKFESWSMILLTVVTSALFGALTVVLVYEISKTFVLDKKQSILIAVLSGAGTPLFIEGTTYRNHSVGTMLVFLSFFILFKTRDNPKSKYFLLSGITTGLAMLSDFSAGLFCMILLIYVLAKGGVRLTPIFLLGAFIAYTPMFYYNYNITGNPLHYVGVENNDPDIFGSVILDSKNMAFDFRPNIYIIYRQLFDPYKGLFFYYPILLLSAIGLLRMLRTYPSESITITGIFVLYVTKFSTWYVWFGTSSPVSRFLTPTIPFLVVPLAYYLKEVNIKLFYLLAVVTLFNSAMTLQPSEYWIFMPTTCVFRPEYAAIMDSFRPLAFPLFTHYLPMFITQGPRARLVEHLAGGFWNVDIRDYATYQPHMPPFTNLIPLAVILVFIWRREVFDRRGNSWRWWAREWARKLSYVGFVLAALITVYIALMLLTYAPAEGEEPIDRFFAVAIVGMSLVITHLMRCVSRVFSKPDEEKGILQKKG